MKEQEYERLTNLLADSATEILSPEEREELQRLLSGQSDFRESDLELVAASIHLTQPMDTETLPTRVRARILADAEKFFSANHQVEAKPAQAEFHPAGNVLQFPAGRIRKSFNWQMAGWYAAAACLLIAAVSWWPQFNSATETKPRIPGAGELRANLIAEAKDLSRIEWTPTALPGMQGVRGDVVWSNAEQKGYMRFVGLPANDVKALTYQLWIFDAEQDERFPVDGGIFDIAQASATSNGEVIIPINARLKIGKATLFAITLEKPGGVVVSKRDRLALVAKVG